MQGDNKTSMDCLTVHHLNKAHPPDVMALLQLSTADLQAPAEQCSRARMCWHAMQPTMVD